MLALLNLLQRHRRQRRVTTGAIVREPVARFGEPHQLVNRTVSFRFNFGAEDLFGGRNTSSLSEKVGGDSNHLVSFVVNDLGRFSVIENEKVLLVTLVFRVAQFLANIFSEHAQLNAAIVVKYRRVVFGGFSLRLSN